MLQPSDKIVRYDDRAQSGVVRVSTISRIVWSSARDQAARLLLSSCYVLTSLNSGWRLFLTY